MDQVFAVTNELRTRGTDNLLAAAERAGTCRVIAQSAERMNERSGGPVKTEKDPLDSRPVPSAARTVAAIKHVEQTVPFAHRRALCCVTAASTGRAPRIPCWTWCGSGRCTAW